ncbi:hypothetical protein FEM48_Zijuj07G0174900 [Ziziphus jujuba var. spinosa]|uniref:Uncharacterized protein n=1 Tax=Ziziphus jujuba var. spinosa TaxID=714518 RepID=A0A978V5Z9_ZIZJJ|nr:hypothetical protein FEM48_Zijuj07G0174900 [Ziziphus jujuba var. spinosa]
MNDLMTKSFTSYVDLKKEAMKDLDLEAEDLEISSSTTSHMDSDLNLFLEEAEKGRQISAGRNGPFKRSPQEAEQQQQPDHLENQSGSHKWTAEEAQGADDGVPDSDAEDDD